MLGFGLLETLDMPLDGLHVLLPDSPESARRIHALKIKLEKRVWNYCICIFLLSINWVFTCHRR